MCEKMRKLLIYFIMLSALCLTGCGKGEVKVESEFKPINDETLAYPLNAHVVCDAQIFDVEPDIVYWAYAVTEQEWSSVDLKDEPAIDRVIDDEIVVRQAGSLKITFPGGKTPDAIGYLHRFPVELYDPAVSGNDFGIRSAIQRHKEYYEYETLEPDYDDGGVFTITFDDDISSGYLYVFEAVWDTTYFRGKAEYAIIVK